MMNIEHAKLKIKFKSLSSEQKDIRLEEKKHKWAMRAARGRQNVLKAKAEADRQPFVVHPFETNATSLYDHRLGLRKEIRSTHLARGFLRGMPYQQIEQFSYRQPDWNRVMTLAARYSGEESGVVVQRYAQWMQEALNGVEPYQTDGHFGSDKRNPNSIDAKVDAAWVKMQNERG